MTIDEAIKKEKQIIKHEQFFQDTHIVFTDEDGEDVTIEMLHCDDTECIEESLEISKYNLEYHEQLVEWLEELKEYRGKTMKHSDCLKCKNKGIEPVYNEETNEEKYQIISCELGLEMMNDECKKYKEDKRI